MIVLINSSRNKQTLSIKTLSVESSRRDLFLVKLFYTDCIVFDINDLNLIDDQRDSYLKKLYSSKKYYLVLVQKRWTRLTKRLQSFQFKLLPTVLISIINYDRTLLSARNKVPFATHSHHSRIIINVRFCFCSVCFENVIIDVKFDRCLFLLLLFWFFNCFDGLFHLERLHSFEFL